MSDTRHVRRKSGRSGGSGLFPAIKTALVDVCHRKKVSADAILKGYGELGLGRPRKDGFHSDFEICSIQSALHTLRPAAPPRVILVKNDPTKKKK